MANQVKIIRPPLYGSVIWDGSNFIYTPQQGFIGRDSYIYTTTNGITSQTITNYTDTVNTAPSATNITITTNAEDLLLINLANYVSDDNLVRPYTITNITTPNLGIVGYSGNVINYKSNGFDGVDQFYYTVSDGQFNSTATITLSIINGSNIQVPQYIADQVNALDTILTDVQSISSDWDTSYTILCANSAKWNNLNPDRYNSVSTVVENNSANWNNVLSSAPNYDQTFTIVSNNSADWNYVRDNISITNTILSTNSADWNTSYNLLCTNSAKWDGTTNNLNNLTNIFSTYSSSWNDAYNLVYSNSSAWDKTYYLNILDAGSANWNTSFSLLTSSSAIWNSNTTNINNLTSLYSQNSGNWNEAYNTVNTLSYSWGDQTALTLLTAQSANWNTVADAKPLYDNAVTILSSNSADWNFVKDNFNSLLNTTTGNSANWTTSYNTVCSNSADWNNSYTILSNISSNYSSNSGNWNNTYTTVNTYSSSWDKTAITTILSSNSSNWDASYTNLTTYSGNWESSYNTLNVLSSNYSSNSGNWTNAYNAVSAGSAAWSDTTVYNSVTTNSANWNSIYDSKLNYDNAVTILSTTSGNWNYVRDNFSPVSNIISGGSANWNNTYNTICANSADWSTITSNVSTLTNSYSSNSANWNISYSLVSTNSSYWDNTNTIDIVNNNYTNWNTTYNIVCANSASWELNKTNLTNLTNDYNLSSVSWNNYYNVVTAGSSVWGDAAAVSIITAQSANYANTYSVVCANSSTWNSVSSVYAKYDATYAEVTANSANWTNTFNIVSTGSASWNNTASLVSSNSAKWLNGGVDVNFTANNLIVSGNAVFYGSLTADGATTQLNTTVVATSAFALNNTGNVDALVVTKTTSIGALANFSNAGGSVLYVDPNNKVGINTSAPNEALTVVGNISASGFVYGQIPADYTVFQSNSGKYEQTSSYVNLSSVTINQLLTTSKPSYDTAYTYVTGVSTNINNFFVTNKPLYDTAYTTVTSQSGTVDTAYTFLTANSAKVGIDTVYRSNSANYESAFTWVAANSGATANTAQINVVFDGGGESINSGSYVIVQIPNNIGILNWALYSDSMNSTAYIEVLSSNFNNYPTFSRISPASTSDANYIKITSGVQKSPLTLATTLTGWLSAVSADSLLKFNLVSNTNASVLTLSLKCKKY
jgi:hypothetical protein